LLYEKDVEVEEIENDVEDEEIERE